MTDDLENLQPEVREALWHIRPASRARFQLKSWETIRAELLRLAEYEQAAGRLAVEKAEFRQRAEKAEAELTALKARIADSPIVSLVYGQGDLLAVISAENPDDWAAKRVRLVEVE